MESNNIFSKFQQNKEYISCCKALYEDDLVKTLFDDIFHPGGLALTLDLAKKLNIDKDSHVLDLATGMGTSVLEIAKKYGCHVVGIDLSEKNILNAQKNAAKQNISHLTRFLEANVDNLPFPDDYFDVVFTECSFCIFLNKEEIVKEISRVLKPNGHFGMTDVTVEKKIPHSFEHVIYQIACIADAKPTDRYLKYFEDGGFDITLVEDKKRSLDNLYMALKKKLFFLETGRKLGLKNIQVLFILDLDFREINNYLNKFKELIDGGFISYVLMTAQKKTFY